jgi:hypothetical protein
VGAAARPLLQLGAIELTALAIRAVEAADPTAYKRWKLELLEQATPHATGEHVQRSETRHPTTIAEISREIIRFAEQLDPGP